jgi:hypothetical protein
MIASSLATPQIWEKEKPGNYNYYLNLWPRTPTGRLKWKESCTIFRCKCCTILTDIIITNEKTLAFSRRFLQKKTVDIYISGNFVRKRPQTYSSGNFVRNNPYQRGGIFFLSSTYLVGQTFINQRTFLPSWSLHFVFAKE